MNRDNKIIADTLNSLNGIQRATPGPNFAQKVWKRVQQQKQPAISRHVLLKAAAVIAIWIGVNMFTLLHVKHRNADAANSNTPQAFMQTYFPNDALLIHIIE